MPGEISRSYDGPAGPEWDKAREAMDACVAGAKSPPCRVCGKADPVIVYPDDHAQTICPDCCGTAEHADGETGHVWEYDRWERDWVCVHCGILRRCTEYSEPDRG